MSCGDADVQAALDLAVDGDTVKVPSGTCTWTKTVTTGSLLFPGYAGKAVTVCGAGIGNTTIRDDVPSTDGNGTLFAIVTQEGKPFRLTGFTFATSPALIGAGQKFSAVVAVNGSSKAVRVDHNDFATDTVSGRGILTSGFLYGVIDHNHFAPGVTQALTIFHETWDGHDGGNGSWAAPLALGSEKAIFLEDNDIESGLVTDAFDGARFVVRHNTIATALIPVQNHGIEGATRSGLSLEVYDNQVSLQAQESLMYLRGGTGVFFNNTITGAGDAGSLGSLLNFRSLDINGYGACDGAGHYDLNDVTDDATTPGGAGDGVFEAGTHAGVQMIETVSDPATLTAGAAWTPNQWVGYSLRNVTKDWGSEIATNTATTITTKPSVHIGDGRVPPHEWDPGDQFEVRRVEACIDQIGRGPGVLLTGYNPPDGTGVTPLGWPGESSEPLYSWNNTINGTAQNGMSPASSVIRENRDYFVGQMRPGYTPYEYPHPLTQSSP
jgi:hypothetical protein